MSSCLQTLKLIKYRKNLLMFKSLINRTHHKSLVLALSFISLILSGCLPDSTDHIEPDSFFEELREQSIFPQPLNPEKFPELKNSASGYSPLGIYKSNEIEWALFDLPLSYNSGFQFKQVSNRNLHIVANRQIPEALAHSLTCLSPQIGYEQLGLFAYPLGICLFFSIFITLERLFSLRRGITFPRKVERALLIGEFPDKKWKKGSAAERIVHVAIHEHASEETLQAYAKLEIAAMDRGMFLLEVIVAGAPLIGLLGTVTGLVEVFSQMPTGGAVDKSLFTQGISLALLTTMTGLTIALPTIFFNAYLHRVIDKRAVALGWLTARLIEASDRKGTPPEIIR